MTQEPKKSVRLKSYDGAKNTIYIELADHPHELVSGVVKKSVGISELIPGYDGPRLILDIDQDGKAIGIEILYPYDEFYDDW